MKTAATVMLLGGSPDTATVVSAMLHPRGHRIQRVPAATDARAHPAPDLLVCSSAAELPQAWHAVPRVVIGRIEDSPERSVEPDADALCRRLHWSFDYGQLFSAIDQLLSAPVPVAAS